MTNLVSLNSKTRLKASVKLAQSLLKDGRFEEVIRVLGDFSQEQLDDPTRILLSRAYRETKAAGKALSVLSHLRADKPANQETLRLLIDIHGDLLNYERVLYFTDLLFSMERHVSSEIQNLLQIYQKLGLTDRSLDLTRFLLREKMVQTSYLPVLTNTVAASGDSELIKDFKSLLTSNTQNTKLLQQKIRRAECVRNGLRIRDIFFQRQGSLLLSPFYDKDPAYACPPFPKNPLKQVLVPQGEVLEILLRLRLVIALSGLEFSGIVPQGPEDVDFAKLTGEIGGLKICDKPDVSSLVVSIVYTNSHSLPHFSLTSLVEAEEDHGPDFIGFLIAENTSLILGDIAHTTFTKPSCLDLSSLLDYLRYLGVSRLPRRVHRLNPPSVSLEQLKTTDPIFSQFFGMWLQTMPTPSVEEMQELFLYYIESGSPACMVVAEHLKKHLPLKPMLHTALNRHLKQNQLKSVREILKLSLHHLDLGELKQLSCEWSSGEIPLNLWVEAGWIRYLGTFYSSFYTHLAKECLFRTPYKLLQQILQLEFIPMALWDAILQKYKRLQPKAQQFLLQILLKHPYRLPPELIANLLEHKKQPYPELFQMLLGTDLLLCETMAQAIPNLPKPLKATCISYWQLKEHLQNEWELWLESPEKSCFLEIRGIIHKNFHTRVHRYAGSLQESDRIPIYRYLLQNYFDGMLTEIFASGVLKRALTNDLVRSIDNWIVKTDGETDLLFLLGAPDPYFRIRLAQNLLCIGNLEGWFLLERQFQAFRSLVGVEIIKGLLNLRPDKAMELFLFPDSKGLNQSQCVEAAVLISSHNEYLDEWHSYSAQVRYRGLVEDLQKRLENLLSSHPKLIPAFFRLFPKLTPLESLKRLGLWNQFDEEHYLILKRWDKNLAANYISVAGLNNTLAELILMEENVRKSATK